MEYLDYIFILGRVLFGGFFIIMGMNHFMKLDFMTGYAASKNVPSPRLAVMAGGLLLLAGGAGILLGAYVEYAVLALALFFVPVSFKMHNFWAISDPQDKMTQMINFLKNMALLGAALLMLSIPTPWLFSLLK